MFLFIKYLIIAILIKFSLSSGQNVQTKVTGRVLTDRTMPLKNSVVSLASDSLVVRMARTNDKGVFVFNNLPRGNYRILIMITGYEKYTSGFFSLTNAKPSRDFGDIELQPSTDKSPLIRF